MARYRNLASFLLLFTAIIALGGIVCDKSIRIAGDELTADIEDYMRRQHNILVGERTAECRRRQGSRTGPGKIGTRDVTEM